MPSILDFKEGPAWNAAALKAAQLEEDSGYELTMIAREICVLDDEALDEDEDACASSFCELNEYGLANFVKVPIGYMYGRLDKEDAYPRFIIFPTGA